MIILEQGTPKMINQRHAAVENSKKEHGGQKILEQEKNLKRSREHRKMKKEQGKK